MCPCYSLRIGTFLLTLAGFLAASADTLIGASPEILLQATMKGNAPFIVWCWGALVAVGLYQFIGGLRASFQHRDPVDVRSVLWSAAVIWLVAVYLQRTFHQSDFRAFDWALLHAFAAAWLASNIANLWLRLRGLVLRSPSLPVYRAPMAMPERVPIRTIRRSYVEEESHYADEQGNRIIRDVTPPVIEVEHGDGGYLKLPPTRQRIP